MHYSLDWLFGLRDLHNESEEKKKRNKVKVDYALVEQVLEMRPDLLDGWSKRVTGSLNEFDLLLLSMLKPPFTENVLKCINETAARLSIPSWLPFNKTLYLRERFSSLLETKSVDLNKASFEDFTNSEQMKDYIAHLLRSSSGQIELGMFLGKGLISKDDLFNTMAMDYLEIALHFHEQFPQIIDHIFTSITCQDVNRCQVNAKRLIDVLNIVPTFAKTFSESLMERIQDLYLVDSSEEACLGLVPSDYCLKLAGHLPIWLTVLGSCLVISVGKHLFYGHIDLLLTLPIDHNNNLGLACSWIRALLNVFSVASDNALARKYCIQRLSQLAELEGRIEYDRKSTACSDQVGDLVRQIVGDELSPSPITFSETPTDECCPLCSNVLSLLSEDILPNSPVEDDNDDKGKQVEVDSKRNELAVLKLLTLMEDWIRSNSYFDPTALQLLAKHSRYQSVALKLCLQYEKKFSSLPFNVDTTLESKDIRFQLLRFLNCESFVDVIKFLLECDESPLRNNQDILIKILAKHPSIMKDIILRFPDRLWSFKVCCTALSIVEVSGSLTDTLSVLSSLKAVIDVCMEQKENIDYQLVLFKNVKILLQNIEEKCLESLSAKFTLETENVIAVLKALQLCTRPIQSLCSLSKPNIPELTAHIPIVKKTLESVLYKVKIILKDNNCLLAFWMGNLKDKR